MTEHTIDCEPTWETVLQLVKHNPTNDMIENLRPACKIADAVRQAQKKGKKSLTFKFKDDGTLTWGDSK